MGMWGNGPYESDDAGDWLSNTFEPVLITTFKEGSDEEARTAAAVLTDYYGKHSGDEGLVKLAIDRLGKIASNPEFTAEWRAATREQIAELEVLLAEHQKARQKFFGKIH